MIWNNKIHIKKDSSFFTWRTEIFYIHVMVFKVCELFKIRTRLPVMLY